MSSMSTAWGIFDMDIESMRNMPNGSQRTSFVLARVMGSDTMVDAVVRPASLVLVIGA